MIDIPDLGEGFYAFAGAFHWTACHRKGSAIGSSTGRFVSTFSVLMVSERGTGSSRHPARGPSRSLAARRLCSEPRWSRFESGGSQA